MTDYKFWIRKVKKLVKESKMSVDGELGRKASEIFTKV